MPNTKILSTIIGNVAFARGLPVNTTSMCEKDAKILQYADDNTLFLQKEKYTIKKVLEIFHWYRVASRLSINVDKTKLVNIGAWGAKRLNWEGQFGLE